MGAFSNRLDALPKDNDALSAPNMATSVPLEVGFPTERSDTRNAMTVDVEDYFQVSAFEDLFPRDRWDEIECRIERNTDRVLVLFEEHGVRATFFVLGWVAERYPVLVERIAAAGHEIASHGCEHHRVTGLSRERFREDVRRSKAVLEAAAGVAVSGYRAPSYSITNTSLWALDILQDEGYRYSSSIYPVRHDHYGIPNAPKGPFRLDGSDLLEVPISAVSLFGQPVPCGGGGFFRLYPYAVSRWLLRRVTDGEQRTAVFYFHPWELDPEQPRQQGIGLRTRFRHYLNLSRMEVRLRALLRDFEWGRMDEVFLDGLSA